MVLERSDPRLDAAAADRLRSAFDGPVLLPEDTGYESARRVWNGAVDRRPAMIARCTGAADVAAAVRFARERDLLVSVRSGGHNVAGSAVCDGGLMIDLSPMKGVTVDPSAGRAWARPGVLLGEFDGETQLFGLATPSGIVTHTGLAGLTLGGGIGWLMRRYALTCDNLFSADVVTADGELVRANDEENPDLLWGLRGGGGNFGVVTRFGYRLHRVGPTVLAGSILYPAGQAGEVLRGYREFAADALDDLTTIVALRTAPATASLPDHVHGHDVIAIGVCWAGNVEDGERAVAPLRKLGSPLADTVSPQAFTGFQAMLDGTVPHGQHYYRRSHDLADLSDAVIQAFTDHAWAGRSKRSYTIVYQLGGAVSRIGEQDTAYGHRDAQFVVNINGISADGHDFDEQVDWVQRYSAAMEPLASGVYVNFLMDEGEDRIRLAYGAEKYQRLVELKTKWDPTNFFRLNQNIAPRNP